MSQAILIVASTRVHVDTQEILRIQDTVKALLDQGNAVDVLVPRVSPLLSAALPSAARIFIIPRLPFCDNPPVRPSLRRFTTAVFMLLRGVALVLSRNYTILHGVNDGAMVVRAINRATVGCHPYVAEFHSPFSSPGFFKGPRVAFARQLEHDAFRHADAVILPDEDTLARFSRKLSRARVSLIPDPHVEIAPDAFTFGEFSLALEHVYAYVLRPRPES